MKYKFNFVVYGTQGGGLVREVGDTYIFVEAPPEGAGLGVGDELPAGWSIAHATGLYDPRLEYEDEEDYKEEGFDLSLACANINYLSAMMAKTLSQKGEAA